MEEPGGAQIHTSEKPPISLQVGMNDAVERLAWISLQQFVQAARAEHQQHHESIMVRARLRDAGLFPPQRAAAVAADNVVGAQNIPTSAFARCDRDARSAVVLADLLGNPTVADRHAGQFGDAPAKHRFGCILRQPLVVGEVVGPHQLALHPIIGVAAEQRAIGGESAHAVFPRNRPCRTQFSLCAPEVEVLHRPLGQVLSLRNGLRLLLWALGGIRRWRGGARHI